MHYSELEIYKIAHKLVLDIHYMTLHNLPLFEMYEEGKQIRRSIKSVKSNIVEGYGRSRYQQDYIRFLTFAIASNDETIDHLKNLFDTKSLTDEKQYVDLSARLDKLGRKLNLFRRSIEKHSLKK